MTSIANANPLTEITFIDALYLSTVVCAWSVNLVVCLKFNRLRFTLMRAASPVAFDYVVVLQINTSKLI